VRTASVQTIDLFLTSNNRDNDDNASDQSDSDDSDAEMTGRRRQQRSRTAAKNSAYILEDEAEPLDLLYRNALANISATKPGRRPGALGGNKRRIKARTNADGKLILGGREEDDVMDVDDAPFGAGVQDEESGVGAYVAALRGKTCRAAD
jgi:ribosomal RNA-processing protein 12